MNCEIKAGGCWKIGQTYVYRYGRQYVACQPCADIVRERSIRQLHGYEEAYNIKIRTSGLTATEELHGR